MMVYQNMNSFRGEKKIEKRENDNWDVIDRDRLAFDPLFDGREYYLWYPLVSDGYGVTDELSHGIFEANDWIGDFLAALKVK